MKQFLSILKEQKIFLIFYFILFVISAFLLLSFSKAQLHIASNQTYSEFFDVFFKYITNLGDGLFVCLVGVGLLFVSFRYAFQLIVSYVVSGIIVQILKKTIFSGIQRPKAYFEGLYDLRLVQGIEIHTNNSFPSGHSASAFALFLSLSIILKNKWLQVPCLLMAAITAYSRVYLSQHFLIDITFGSLAGVLIAMLYYYYQKNITASWIDKSIQEVIRKK